MLQEIEVELVDHTLSAAEQWHLRQRGELMRGLLAPSWITYHAVIVIATFCLGRAPPAREVWPVAVAGVP
jgi:hypothetical protein